MPRNLKPIPKTPRETSQSQTGDPYLSGTKPSTNSPNENRGLQNSFKDSNWKDFSIGIKDIDESIIFYFENIIKPSVIQNGQRQEVPIIYGTPERWKSVQVDGYYRDKNGKIMFPLIMFKRDNMEKNRTLGNKLDGNEVHLYQIFESKYNKKNMYDQFSVITNREPSKQLYLSVVPDYVTINYSCIMFTEYMEQMDKIIEAVNFSSDSYWGDAKKYQFRAKIDSFNTATEMNIGEDRLVKTTFNITLNGYIITNTINKKLANSSLIYTPAQVVVGLETVYNSETFQYINSTPSEQIKTPPLLNFIDNISGGGGSSNNEDSRTVIFNSIPDTSNVLITGETDLYLYNISGSLNNNNENIEALCVFDIGDSGLAYALRVKAYIDNNLIWDSDIFNTGILGENISLRITLMRESSTVLRVSTISSTKTGITFPDRYTRVTGLDLNNCILKVTGESTVNDNDVTLRMIKGWWYPASA